MRLPGRVVPRTLSLNPQSRPRNHVTRTSPAVEPLEVRVMLSLAHPASRPVVPPSAALIREAGHHPHTVGTEPPPGATPRLPLLAHLHVPPHGPFVRVEIPSLYPAWNLRNLQEIQAEHNTAVQVLVQALGPNARPMPQFQNLQAPDAVTFIRLAQTIENTGAGAYAGATPYIYDRTLIDQSGRIAFAEAMQAGYLNTLLNGQITGNPTPFAIPLTAQQAAMRAMPFIASLNGGPSPTYSTTPSPANDIAILNFALLLEYLAADFYNINLPLYQGVVG